MSTLDDATHAVLADRFRDLVQQDVQHFVRQCMYGLHSSMSAERVAMDVAATCRELFCEQTTASHACRRLGLDPEYLPTLNRLVGKAKAIADRVPADVWEFGAVRGARVDVRWQHPWGQCDERHPITFVVAPAYLADGRAYAPQLVFTAPRSRWQ